MNTIFLTFCSLLLTLTSFHTCGQELSFAETNLKNEWLVQEGGKFRPYSERETSPEVVYIELDARDCAGKFLKIRSVLTFTLFINNKLAGTGPHLYASVDSLATTYSASNLLVAIHRRKAGHGDITTTLVSPVRKNPLTDGLVKREGSFFKDFGILGILLLLGLAVLIVRLNPKLASDYYSFAGIFSTREIQDSQVYTRIGSSTNILFYAYCSMLLAYYFIVIFHFTGSEFPVANEFQGEHFWSVVIQWLKLAASLLFIFFLKILLVFAASYLFGIPEVAGIHFFNWVRLLLIIFGLLTIILFVYFIWHGQSPDVHAMMLKLLGWIIGGWIILIFLKLSGKASASMFHLFSYICATELIPFLLIIKVLYK
jgi:hypothetical protein